MQSSLSPGIYQIKMDGDAKKRNSTVNLKTTAVQQIEADSEGDFSYPHNTKAVPPEDFEINVGGVKKKGKPSAREDPSCAHRFFFRGNGV